MDTVHARAGKGIQLLMGRQVLVQMLTFGGGVILARVLDPAQVGLYAVASFLVGMVALLGDFGLAASFIQRRAELTERELRIGFTLQQIVTTVVVAALLLLAPWLAALAPKAPPETVWLVRALALNLYLMSWRSMSALQLERALRYERLARAEVAENLCYQGVAVLLALRGCGVWSFVGAVLARGLLGTLLLMRAAPWPVGFAFDGALARSILRFGIPFQFQNLANQAAGWVTPLLVGGLVGPHAVGYLTWAVANAQRPLVLVDNVMRVAYPHFSRIQEDREEVERLLTRYLTGLLVGAGLWCALLLAGGPSLVRWIYTAKWAPAIPALLLFATALGADVILWTVGVTLNSLGDVHRTTRVLLARNLANVGLSVPLVLGVGFNGVALAYLAADALAVPWMLRGLGPGAPARLLRDVLWVVPAVAASAALGSLALQAPLGTAGHAVLSAALAGAAYLGVMWWVGPSWLKEPLRRRMRAAFCPA
jgi:PST family polysaccharide transporter